MENVQTAIQHAYDAKPSEFKSAILDALNDKIADHVSARKMELAGSIFRDDDDEEQQQSNDLETEFQSSSEGNVDEDL
jgi:hypothetical protein